MNALLKPQHRPADTELHQPRILDPELYRYDEASLGEIRIQPYSPIVGGVVRGFRFQPDVRTPDEVQAFLYRSLLEYGFLSFEPGSVAAGDFEPFAALFGAPRFAGNPQAPRVGARPTPSIRRARKRAPTTSGISTRPIESTRRNSPPCTP